MTMQQLWANRTTSERASLIIALVGCAYLGVLAIWGQGPVVTGQDFAFYLAMLAFGALFLVPTVTAALAMLVLGGADFAAPWRRALDKLLPGLTLAMLWLMLTGL